MLKPSNYSEKGAILALMAATACGSGAIAEVVRPQTPTPEDVGEKACHVPEDPNSPLIVDWKDYQQQELEITMKDGVAVVAYDCDTLQLLPKCHVDGSYGYQPASTRRNELHLRNLDEIRAYLPTSGLNLGREIGADVGRGTSLDIALATVGRIVTTRAAVSRIMLRGECEGATHIVRGATIGAFRMGTSAVGQVGGNAGVVSGTSSSEKSISASSGDMQACDQRPPDGSPATCSTPVRLHLEEIQGQRDIYIFPDIDHPITVTEDVRSQEQAVKDTTSIERQLNAGFHLGAEAQNYHLSGGDRFTDGNMWSAGLRMGWALKPVDLNVGAGLFRVENGGMASHQSQVVDEGKQTTGYIRVGVPFRLPVTNSFGLRFGVNGMATFEGGQAAMLEIGPEFDLSSHVNVGASLMAGYLNTNKAFGANPATETEDPILEGPTVGGSIRLDFF